MSFIVDAQPLCFGAVLGTAVPATADVAVGCTYARTGAGAYTILFDTVPPGPTVPSINDVVVLVNVLAVDGATTNALVTKTTTAAGCTGFTVAITGAADTSFNWICFRKAQG